MFGESKSRWPKSFADQAVIAIENTRLFNEVQAKTRDLTESLEQQTATSEVLKVISSSAGELGPVFKSMLSNALRICDAKFGNLLLFDGEGFTLAETYNSPAGYAELYKDGREASGAAHGSGPPDGDETGRPYCRYHGGRPGPERSAAECHGSGFARSQLSRGADAKGTGNWSARIVIYRQEVRPFNDKQIELVTGFANQAVIAIENTRLLKELRERTDDLQESLE